MPIVPIGYNGRPNTLITLVIFLTIIINRRRINFPFLIIDLKSTNVLIKRKFLEYYNLKLDYVKGKN